MKERNIRIHTDEAERKEEGEKKLRKEKSKGNCRATNKKKYTTKTVHWVLQLQTHVTTRNLRESTG